MSSVSDDSRKWKVLSSEYLFSNPWLTVRKDHVQLPNGFEMPEYFVTEYPEWINVIAITKDKQFVFVKQYRHGLGEVSFEICAGVCEDDDPDPLYSAQRELLEETGYGRGTWSEYMVVSANPSTLSNLVHCFLATDVEKIGEQNLEPSEDLTVHLLSIEEVRQLLFDDEIKQAVMAAPLWKYLAQNP